VLQDTAELFRSVMAQHENRLVALATELETCQQYARIEQARLAQRLVLEWHIDEALLAVSVPPFSLQPLIENAIRHGIEPLAKGGKVVITAQRFEQQLVLRVTNPVVSELERYSATKAKQHNGIALDNITQRLALMYDQAAQFEHGIVEGRYEAQMNLPLEFAT
jgi:two-component system sensor histidine kinase AlgZ